MKKHLKIIIGQIIFLAVVITAVYFLYPRTEISIQEDVVRFNPINAKVIIFSENPDFSNPRYLEINEEVSLNLKPGTYYWKASNDLIEGFKNKFTIESEVSMKVDVSENKSDLVNVGNVKINVSKTKNGVMVGHIILEPEESEEIENSGKYTGRQENE